MFPICICDGCNTIIGTTVILSTLSLYSGIQMHCRLAAVLASGSWMRARDAPMQLHYRWTVQRTTVGCLSFCLFQSSPFLHLAKRTRAPLHVLLSCVYMFMLCRVLWLPYFLSERRYYNLNWYDFRGYTFCFSFVV